jgi:hypothetical protein
MPTPNKKHRLAEQAALGQHRQEDRAGQGQHDHLGAQAGPPAVGHEMAPAGGEAEGGVIEHQAERGAQQIERGLAPGKGAEERRRAAQQQDQRRSHHPPVRLAQRRRRRHRFGGQWHGRGGHGGSGLSTRWSLDPHYVRRMRALSTAESVATHGRTVM